jgi:hypothetical protein
VEIASWHRAGRPGGQGGLAGFESADGRWLYYGKDEAGRTSIWRVPVDGGEEAKVLDGSTTVNFAVTAKGIYLRAHRGDPPVATIEYFDLKTRKTAVLHTPDRGFWFGFALAPDESAILFAQIDSYGSDLIWSRNSPDLLRGLGLGFRTTAAYPPDSS